MAGAVFDDGLPVLMIDKKIIVTAIITAVICQAVNGWINSGSRVSSEVQTSGFVPAAKVTQAAGSDFDAEKAVISTLLAAAYSVQKRAAINSATALLDTLPSDDSALNQRQRIARQKILATLPEGRRESDAAVKLYVRGIEALAQEDHGRIERAIDVVKKQMADAGLTRLTRYVAPIRKQIEQARTEGKSQGRTGDWIKELENVRGN